MRTASIAFILLATSIAHADPRTTMLARTCAEVAPTGLDETYRARAEQLLSRALEQANLLVVDRDCMETYRIEFANGNRELVLEGPGARVSRELGQTGDLATEVTMLLEMHRRMRNHHEAPPREDAEPAREEAGSARRPVATAYPTYPVGSDEAFDETSSSESSEPPPVRTLFYGRFGAGTVSSAGPGAAWSLGLRHTMGKADIDASLTSVADAAAAFKVEVLSTPAANRTAFFAGGGLSISNVKSEYDEDAGLGLELSAGVSLSASHRWFVQADLSLPFFSTPDGYPAMFAMSVGYGLASH